MKYRIVERNDGKFTAQRAIYSPSSPLAPPTWANINFLPADSYTDALSAVELHKKEVINSKPKKITHIK